MNKQHIPDGEGEMPSLVSLALFAVVFSMGVAVVEFGAGLVDPVRIALAELPHGLKAGALAAFILGIMAVARIAYLLGGGGKGEGK